ncbi:DUF3365 domain-containing protein [Bizionia gelidisalsuginis]|uniref:DUF3365 domain-containing protein n=2 Tax=Bizionia TaxID=283785 RepID=A0A8H2QGP6_9FLAO|nr:MULTISPECIES: DUF3365 domain-containing protein [Bizionia]TYB80371.1 DUF3365 domain-containing protein [Bizionia saleffrena]TYC09665.1 DUF3365 domain-containing protein [Bizionia gelidisalsuginis]
MKKYIIITAFIALFLGCKDSKKEELTVFEKQMEAENHPGKKLMETNCYVCHSPSASQKDRVGPPMIAIKRHYLSPETTKEDFTKALQAWIKNPNEKEAKMFGAVKRFGVMPKQVFPEETIKQIAEYMYDFDIDVPEWFQEHFKGEKKGNKSRNEGGRNREGKRMQANDQKPSKHKLKENFDTLPYGERGLKYALATKAVLGKNLMGTIQRKGTIEALAFCNEQAYPLTDSMSVVYNASIKRVSDKPRNEKNRTRGKELEYINAFKNDIKNHKEPVPIVAELENSIQVFYPITTNVMCLQCHGKPTDDIKTPILKKIRELYPNDKAIGYGVNEVRGLWNVTFDK